MTGRATISKSISSFVKGSLIGSGQSKIVKGCQSFDGIYVCEGVSNFKVMADIDLVHLHSYIVLFDLEKVKLIYCK